MADVLRRQKKRFVKSQGNVDTAAEAFTAAEAGNQEELARILAAMEQAQGGAPSTPTDRHHPLWGINGGPGSESALAARLGGVGVLGAGALGLGRAARMGAAGLTGSGQAGLSGAGALRVGSYSGPGYGTYRAPTAGGPGVGGTTGVPGGSSGPVAAGRGAAQGAGGYMGGSGAGAGAGKDEKKKPRRKYTPFRVDDCEDGIPPGYVNPQSQTYGSDRDIAPAPRKDDGWDPRQW